MENQNLQIEYNKFNEINIYLTGYSVFKGLKENPAEIISKYIFENKDQINTKYTTILYNQIFEVNTEYVDKNIDKLFSFINEKNNDKNTLHIIISFGVAQNRKVNTIETRAQNYIYDLIKNEKIDKFYFDNFFSKNPVKNIVKGIQFLKEAECKFSNDAGTYLCNYIFYKTLTHYLKNENICSFFIHVPLFENYSLEKQCKFLKNFIIVLEDLYIKGNEEKRKKIIKYEINEEEDEHIDEWNKKKKEKTK